MSRHEVVSLIVWLCYWRIDHTYCSASSTLGGRAAVALMTGCGAPLTMYRVFCNGREEEVARRIPAW